MRIVGDRTWRIAHLSTSTFGERYGFHESGAIGPRGNERRGRRWRLAGDPRSAPPDVIPLTGDLH
jgi:hypothetical protein